MLRRTFVSLNMTGSTSLQDALLRVHRRVPPQAVTSSTQLRTLLEEEGLTVPLDSLRAQLSASYEHLFCIVPGTAAGAWGVTAQQQTAGSSAPAQRQVPTPSPTSSSSSSAGLYLMQAALRQHREHNKGPLPSDVSVRDLAASSSWTVPQLATVLSGAEVRSTFQPSVSLRVRPIRPSRGAHVFVDADELTASEVQLLWDTMRYIPAQSTKLVVRQPATSMYSSADIVAPYGIASYLLIEKQVALLRSGTPVVLKDVAYFCSDAQFRKYVDHVSQRTTFPDADVFVCCPSEIRRISQ